MCAGCPHRGLFYALVKNKATVIGDIGCYTLGATAPMNAMDSTICMGASVSGLHGFNKALGEAGEKHAVGVIGDSTFMHSGVTGLIDIAYNGSNSTVVILDNSITGMTGHQNNPTNGLDIHGNAAPQLDLVMFCKGMGIKNVVVVDPFDVKQLEKVLKEETARPELSVIIAQRPCALIVKQSGTPYYSDPQLCRNCGMCMRIGCPAIKKTATGVWVDPTQCVGCGLCARVCPFGAQKPAQAKGGQVK
jgi:indolepyruvate ferredoxin oxidoreductase alpha subunit